MSHMKKLPSFIVGVLYCLVINSPLLASIPKQPASKFPSDFNAGSFSHFAVEVEDDGQARKYPLRKFIGLVDQISFDFNQHAESYPTDEETGLGVLGTFGVYAGFLGGGAAVVTAGVLAGGVVPFLASAAMAFWAAPVGMVLGGAIGTTADLVLMGTTYVVTRTASGVKILVSRQNNEVSEESNR